jgi:acyl-CoA synthetase (AMP-forming)/AMP-acid ligase II
VSDIDTVVVDSLKVLDPERPIREGAAFKAAIEGEGVPVWLRTGDFGFVDEGGEVFVTGRIKDIIIIRGMNHYPQDIENTVQNSHPALRRDSGAVFAEFAATGQEELVVVQEVERTHRQRFDSQEVIANIREAVATEHELAIREIVLIRTGSIPKTTSGKIRRSLTRELWRNGELELAMRDASR